MTPNKYVYWLFLLFLVFAILNTPTQAGDVGNDFFGWIGDGLSRGLDFLDGLFDRDGTSNGTET